MLSLLLLTAFSVSIDSFFCGFSLPQNNKNKYLSVPIIAVVVFVMCVIANYTAKALSSLLTEEIAELGGIILVCIGVYNLIKKDEDPKPKNYGFFESVLSGFAVGLDGSLANLSLSLMGINAFFVPLVIALFHALLVGLGIFLSGKLKSLKIDKLKPLPPLLLIGLGAYKIISIFI